LEIDQVIGDLPNNKSLGLDGFNNEFLKWCLPLIKTNYYNLYNEFCTNDICLRSLNSSYITLIPKKEGPSTASDYRPMQSMSGENLLPPPRRQQYS
jgi:mannosylglycoprotein endo-beta-mannosidase